MNLRTRLSKSQSRSFARTRRDRRFWAAGLVVVVLLAWVFVFSRLSGLNAFEITNVQIFGADPDIVSALRTAALSELNGSYFALFDRANAALYPKSAIAAAIMSASARVDEVDIHHAGIHGLSITVNERTPAAVVVCAELPDFSSDPDTDGNCYLADSTGIIFEAVSSSSPELADRYYEPSLADSDPTGQASPDIIGSYATSTQEFSALQSFVDGVRASRISTFGVLMKDSGEYELYAENPSGAPADASVATSTGEAPDIAVIYFNDSSPFPTELSDLTAFWDKEMSQDSASQPRFESIDLRYGPNVFYRLEK